MANIAAARKSVLERILGGDGRTSKAARKAAFDNAGVADGMRALVEKVAHEPAKIADGDLAAAKASGATEDEIFETIVCAAIGQASRQYEAALAALAAAVKERT